MPFRLVLGNEKPKFRRPELLMTVLGIPEPLWGVNPRTIKGKDWWDVVRKEAYAKNNFCCFACGVYRLDAKYKQHLEAHEVYEENPVEAYLKFTEIVALCPACHSFIHRGRLQHLVLLGRVTREKQVEVMEHGRDTLGPKLNLEMGRRIAAGIILPAWPEWRLYFEGKAYAKDPAGKIIPWKKPSFLGRLLKGGE